MTELETTLRRGLDTFADETAAVTSPDLAAVRCRAGTPGRTGRRWPKVSAVVAAGLIVTSGAAAAAGVLPKPVENALSDFRSWGFAADHGAERMATTTDDGMTYELWLAPLDGGGSCSTVLVDGPNGEVEHPGSHCKPDEAASGSSDEFIDLAWPERVSDNFRGTAPGAAVHDTASGRAPRGTAHVNFRLEDGSTLTVRTQRDGWFVTTFPGVADGTRILGMQAVAADGRILASTGGT